MYPGLSLGAMNTLMRRGIEGSLPAHRRRWGSLYLLAAFRRPGVRPWHGPMPVTAWTKALFGAEENMTIYRSTSSAFPPTRTPGERGISLFISCPQVPSGGEGALNRAWLRCTWKDGIGPRRGSVDWSGATGFTPSHRTAEQGPECEPHRLSHQTWPPPGMAFLPGRPRLRAANTAAPAALSGPRNPVTRSPQRSLITI